LVILSYVYLDELLRTRNMYSCICCDLHKEKVVISLVTMGHIAFSVED